MTTAIAASPVPSRRSSTSIHGQDSDLELLDALLSTRSNQAWNAFYRRFERLIIGCIRRVLDRCGANATESVDDIVGSVCLKLVSDDYYKLRQYDRSRGYRLSSWVGLIASNAAHDALRRRGPTMHVVEGDDGILEQPSAERSPLESATLREQQETLNRAVQELSPNEQLFLLYYFKERRRIDEIARLLDISVATVYSRKNKLCNALKQIVADMASRPKASTQRTKRRRPRRSHVRQDRLTTSASNRSQKTGIRRVACRDRLSTEGKRQRRSAAIATHHDRLAV